MEKNQSRFIALNSRNRGTKQLRIEKALKDANPESQHLHIPWGKGRIGYCIEDDMSSQSLKYLKSCSIIFIMVFAGIGCVSRAPVQVPVKTGHQYSLDYQLNRISELEEEVLRELFQAPNVRWCGECDKLKREIFQVLTDIRILKAEIQAEINLHTSIDELLEKGRERQTFEDHFN